MDVSEFSLADKPQLLHSFWEKKARLELLERFQLLNNKPHLFHILHDVGGHFDPQCFPQFFVDRGESLPLVDSMVDLLTQTEYLHQIDGEGEFPVEDDVVGLVEGEY